MILRSKNIKNHKFNLIFYPVVLMAIITTLLFSHLPQITGNNKNLEQNLHKIFADYTFYLDGALSLFSESYEEKYNGRKQPLLASKDIKETHFKDKIQNIDALYPYSNFKFGYSLVTAGITKLIPKTVFENKYHRLSFTNLILTVATLCLIIYIFQSIGRNIYAGILASFLLASDVFLIHNNYVYQSHTISGIFFVFLGLSFYKFNKISYFRIFLICLCLVFSILSSSHVYIAAFFTGLIIFWHQYNLKNSAGDKLKLILVCSLGSMLPFLYILFVEFYYGFRELGLITYFDNLLHYSDVVGRLINSYDIADRNITHFSLWNPFYLYMIIPLLFINLPFKSLRVVSLSKVKDFIIVESKKPLSLIWFPLIFVIIFSIFTSQPIIRALLDKLVYINIITALLMYRVYEKNILGKTFIILCILLFSFNIYLYGSVFKTNNKTITFSSIKNSVYNEITNNHVKDTNIYYHFNEKEKMWEHIKIFHAKMGEYDIPQGDLGDFSLSLEDFVKKLKITYPNQKKIIVVFDPLDIIEQYSHTRRFTRRFQPRVVNMFGPEVAIKDFRLIEEIMRSIQQPKGNSIDYKIKISSEFIIKRHPVIFDQENNYIFGQKAKINKLLGDTALKQLNFKYLYKFTIIHNDN